MDIGSALQGLITVSVGSLLGISALHLHIRTGDHININGDGNMATIVKANLFPHGVPAPGLQFKLAFFALLASAVFFPTVSPFLVRETYWIALVMIPMAILGVVVSERKSHASLHLIASLLISILVIRNHEFMWFTSKFGPIAWPTFNEIISTSPGYLLGTIADKGPGFISALFAVGSICALVGVQIWIGLAFLTNAGTYDNAFRLSFYSIVAAFGFVCVACGAIAALQAPWMIWPGASGMDPFNMIRLCYAILTHTFGIS